MIKSIDLQSKEYPALLKELSNPPQKLNILGSLGKEDETAIAVIGSRRMSLYGRNVIRDLIPRLIKQSFTIVSGMAEGIDSYSQELALEAGGRTIGVLGFGFNYLKSSSNYSLAKKILKNNQGAIISPFKNSQKPEKWTFVERNKIIAGLSKGVLVIEATEKSGTFTAVETTLSLGREVFAVPGSIFSYQTKGTHFLIKTGACLVESEKDIIEILC